MKYTLAVEVKLIEIPDEPEAPEIRPGDDPLKAMTGVLTGIAAPMLHPPVFMGSAAGFDFRKATEIRVSNFGALAQIISRFDELVADIEHEKLHA